ncbi:MAG: hypothetical protein ACRC1M_08285 [Methanobacteriaceae archaeon]
MEKVKTTLNIEKDLLKKLKIIAVNNGTTQTEEMNKALKRGLKIIKNEKIGEKLKKINIDNHTKTTNIDD